MLGLQLQRRWSSPLSCLGPLSDWWSKRGWGRQLLQVSNQDLLKSLVPKDWVQRKQFSRVITAPFLALLLCLLGCTKVFGLGSELEVHRLELSTTRVD